MNLLILKKINNYEYKIKNVKLLIFIFPYIIFINNNNCLLLETLNNKTKTFKKINNI